MKYNKRYIIKNRNMELNLKTIEAKKHQRTDLWYSSSCMILYDLMHEFQDKPRRDDA